MAKMKVSVKVADLDAFRTLAELLCKHKDSLPKEIVDCVNGIADGDVFEFGYDEIAKLGQIYATCFADGVEVKSTISVNKYLKRVKHADGFIYPSEMQLVSDSGITLMEW
jgi:hypothetical protein